ncbi:hypothetical protein [Muricomes intestini]|uniref:hypothetical protein n=1 Tax=Muricomes intestini TaxID=1796634 RepID=UPI001404DB30|nr:hypothetical protein [Muricomes intestini]
MITVQPLARFLLHCRKSAWLNCYDKCRGKEESSCISFANQVRYNYSDKSLFTTSWFVPVSILISISMNEKYCRKEYIDYREKV